MEAVALSAEVRETRGKGPARQLRMRGLIPAVLYGPGREPKPLSVEPGSLEKALRGAFGRNQLIELSVGGATELAVVRDVEVHPVSRVLLHADFYAVARDRMVRAEVPFSTTGRAVGVQKGGALRKFYRTLPIMACPQDVPAKIEVDVTPLERNESITVANLPLPAGVSVTLPPTRRVVIVDAHEKKQEEEPEATAAAAPAAG
ncbi:MAG: 50S ribosomal protein L25 [Sandaracinaceae bacterium]